MTNPSQPVRVLLTCTGIGTINRGIETFFRELFDGLKDTAGLQLRLLKGAPDRACIPIGTDPREHVVWNLPRTGTSARALGPMVRRNAYVIEQWSSFVPVLLHIFRFRPRVIFYSDSNLGFLLHWFRWVVGDRYRLLFSNGGPVHPPFIRTDYVHQVAPAYYDEALYAGESAAKHFLLPYGITPVPAPQPAHPGELRALRRNLGLPLDRKIILSVGWIRRAHKRMDYLIREVAQLPRPRPFLLLVGAMDSGSAEVLQLAERLLGPGNFAARSVPYSEVFPFYRAADCFVLASLHEGFGRAYLEALMHGLPIIAHASPITRYILGSEAVLADLTQPGELARRLSIELQKSRDLRQALSRWQRVLDRFSWRILAPGYLAMLEACASNIGSTIASASHYRFELGNAHYPVHA